MNKSFLCSILFLTIYLIFSLLIFAEDIIINAEIVSYDKKNGKVYAEQNVRVKYKDILLETETLVYDIEQNKIYTTTDTFLTYHNNRLFAKSLIYDVNSESFIIQDFYVYYEPYYCYSSTCAGNKDEQLLSNAKVTHCGLKKPHYHFKSKSVVVKPNDKIKLYSSSLIIGSLPIIWVPYYKISLRPKKDYFVLDPSYENERGLMLKVKYGRKISDDTNIALIMDSSYKHLGLGSEVKYRLDRHNGIVYLYSVKEFEKAITRWNFRVNNTHSLGKNWFVKTNVEFISDKQLYYFYEKDNWFLIRQELNSAVSLSRDVQSYTFRFSYLRNDKYDDIVNKFVNVYCKLPVEFVVQPFGFKYVKFSNNFKIVSTFTESTTYYNVALENNLSIMSPFKILPQITFSPSTMLKTVFESDSNFQLMTDKTQLFYNIYYFALPVRYVGSKYGSLDLVYNYGIRSVDDSLSVSTTVVANNVSFRVDFYHRKTFAKISTLYDFLSENIKNWYDRFQPISFAAGVLYKNLSVTTNVSYSISQSMIRNFQIGTDYTFLQLSYISLNYAKDNSKPDLHFFSPSINIYIPENLQARLRSSLAVTKDKIDLLNSTLEFYKDLHCWEGKIFYNIRKSLSAESYVYEFGGFVSLKFKPYVGSGGKVSEVDKRYFPWRE